jgi:hypothetical protein
MQWQANKTGADNWGGQSRFGRGNALVGGLMLGLWLAMLLVSAWPQLHHWLHQDSQSPQHECLATQLHKGHLSAVPPVNAAVVAPPGWFALPPSSSFLCCASADVRLAHSRAPPVPISILAVVG